MPGPLNTSRKAGPRPDPNGNPRVPNKRQAKRLAARQAAHPQPSDKYRAGFRLPGSQNRNK